MEEHKREVFDKHVLQDRIRRIQREEAKKNGLDDPNEFDWRPDFEFKSEKYVVDTGMMDAMSAYRRELEEKMFKMASISEPHVPRGKGILEQISDSTEPATKSYSEITMKTLEEILKDITSSTPEPITMFTGARGRRELETAMRFEGLKREQASQLVREYLGILNEYDMLDGDKADCLAEIREKYHQLTGEHIDIPDGTIRRQYEDESSRPHIMSTRGIELRNPGLSMDLKHLPDFLSKPELSGKLISAYPGFIVTEMMDEYGARKYMAGLDPFDGKDSTPEVPNLGDSPTGEDKLKGWVVSKPRRVGKSWSLFK